MPETVRRVASMSAEEFDAEHVKRQIPVVISGAIEGWKALSRWKDPAYFKQTLGDRMVPIAFPTDGNNYFKTTMRSMPMSEFVDLIHSGVSCYLHDAPLRFTPELVPDVEELRYLESFEREYLGALLQRCEGNVSRAARESGLHRKSIERLVKKYELDARQHKAR